MIGVVVFGVLVGLGAIGVEALRWALRPEARRLRAIRKHGDRR